LLHIQVGAGLIKHIDVSLLHTDHSDRETLELSTRKGLETCAVQEGVKLKIVGDSILDLPLVPARQDLIHAMALDGLWDLVHILGLDHGLEMVLQDLGEIVLEL
jgi:hypothetical protein